MTNYALSDATDECKFYAYFWPPFFVHLWTRRHGIFQAQVFSLLFI